VKLVTRPAVAPGGWARFAGGPEWHRVTFHSQPQWYARFDPHGGSVIYSLDRDDESGESDVLRSEIDRPSVIPLRVAGRLLDVSLQGGYALATPSDHGASKLVVVELAAGEPRAIADRVADAAWGPDGRSLAIVRDGEREQTLEYPINHVLARHRGLSLPRVSRDGRRLAYVEHAPAPDPSTRLVIVDVDRGNVLAASPMYVNPIDGIAWSADGREAWFSTGTAVRALDLDRHERVVLRAGAHLQLCDVDRDGRMLVAPLDLRSQLFAGPREATIQRELGFFDRSVLQSISQHGGWIAMLQVADELGPDGPAIYVRYEQRMPMKIGAGHAAELLPDGTALLVTSSGPTQLQRIELTSDTRTAIPLGKLALDIYDRPAIAEDGHHVVIRAALPGGAMRLWLLDLAADAQPVGFGPEAFPPQRHPVSPDGAWVAVRGEGAYVIKLLSTRGVPDRTIELTRSSSPIRFSDDGKALFVHHVWGWPRPVVRVELDPVKETPWAQLDRAIREPQSMAVDVASDGSTIAYSVDDTTSDLYVVDPPR